MEWIVVTAQKKKRKEFDNVLRHNEEVQESYVSKRYNLKKKQNFLVFMKYRPASFVSNSEFPMCSVFKY